MTTPDAPACRVCGRPGARFSLGSSGGPVELYCLRHAIVHRRILRQALRVAGVVGTLQFLINQADVVLAGQVTARVVLKIALTYSVPFLVSTYSALAVSRMQR